NDGGDVGGARLHASADVGGLRQSDLQRRTGLGIVGRIQDDDIAAVAAAGLLGKHVFVVAALALDDDELAGGQARVAAFEIQDPAIHFIAIDRAQVAYQAYHYGGRFGPGFTIATRQQRHHQP